MRSSAVRCFTGKLQALTAALAIAPVVATLQWLMVQPADAASRQRGAFAEVALIAGAAPAKAGPEGLPRRAGIVITLDDGWKTYWRYPGDSGVPPRFDFSGSQNVRSVSVEWPAPIRFADGGGISIGYARQVVFPLKVELADAARPATLHLKLDYAVCEKLCVPDAAELRLPLTEGWTDDVTLKASEARVPVPAVLGDAGPLAILAVRSEPGTTGPRIVVDLRSEEAELDLFAEGPSEDWSLPLPEPIAVAGGAPGIYRFAFDLDGLPPGPDPVRPVLRLTAVTPRQAIEVTARPD